MENALASQSVEQDTLSPLNEQEEADLAVCEADIGCGLQSFIEVGRALQKIRDERLYRSKHPTFADYCFVRWNIGRAHAGRCIDASVVAGFLSPIGDIVVRESQVRPLTRVRDAEGKLDRKTIVKLWNRAVEMSSGDAERGKRVTAKTVEMVVAPLIKRRLHEKAVERFRDHRSSGRPRIAKNAAVPIRMAGGMIPTVTLQLPLNNPQATVGSMASNFDKAYIQAVVEGLQWYLEHGHIQHTFGFPEDTSEPADSSSMPVTEQADADVQAVN